MAYFGTFGYELDLNHLIDEEFEKVKKQIAFMKEHRALLQYGDFYRLRSPFACDMSAWMVVSEDRKRAIVGCYTSRSNVNDVTARVKLKGLQPERMYHIGESIFYGDELMNIGLVLNEKVAPGFTIGEDFQSVVLVIQG